MGTWGSARTSTTDHRRWARDVLHRDQYTCQHCGYQGTPGAHDVESDHITPVAFKGRPYDLDNGQTLCIPCHQAKTKGESVEGLHRRAARGRAPAEPHPGLL